MLFDLLNYSYHLDVYRLFFIFHLPTLLHNFNMLKAKVQAWSKLKLLDALAGLSEEAHASFISQSYRSIYKTTSLIVPTPLNKRSIYFTVFSFSHVWGFVSCIYPNVWVWVAIFTNQIFVNKPEHWPRRIHEQTDEYRKSNIPWLDSASIDQLL